jgi:hypothetical protein
VEVRFGEKPGLDPAAPKQLIFATSVKTEAGEPALRIWRLSQSQLIHIEYQDGMKFWLDCQGAGVWVKWSDPLTLEDAAAYLLGPVFGLVLRLRGLTCLHASAFAFDGHAVAFVGGEGAGKSTTAAAFARQGHAVLSDDVVALVEREGAFYVLPAYPHLSLWPDSVEMVYGPDKKVPRFSQAFDKRRLALDTNELKFEEQTLPLKAVFILGERTRDAAAPFLETLKPRDALLSLVANSYAAHLVDNQTRGGELALFGRLVASVPIRRLRPHADAARLPLLCDLVCDTLASGAASVTESAHSRGDSSSTTVQNLPQ